MSSVNALGERGRERQKDREADKRERQRTKEAAEGITHMARVLHFLFAALLTFGLFGEGFLDFCPRLCHAGLAPNSSSYTFFV